MKTTRANFQKKMEWQFKQWGTWIKVVQAKAEKADAYITKALRADSTEFEILESTDRNQQEIILPPGHVDDARQRAGMITTASR